MKVGILSRKGNFDNTLGQGTQRYIYELWKNLQELHKKGIHIEKLEIGLGNSPFIQKASFSLLSPFYRIDKYDIIHILAGMPLVPIIKGRHTKIVTNVNEFIVLPQSHPLQQHESKQALSLNPIVRVFYYMLTDMLRMQQLSSDYMIAISEKTKMEAISLGYESKKIYIVNLGIDERFSKPLKKKAHRGKFKVGFLGGFNVRKNAIFAIRAFKKIKDPDMVFELWGRKSAEYENLVKEAGRDSRIKFMGFAPEEKLLDIYESFDVFVYPSIYAGLELELLEAQARGVPVIMYKEGNPTVEAKYYFAAEDEEHMAEIIKGMKKSRGKENPMLKKARDYAISFTWKKCAENTIKVYEDIERREKGKA